MHKISNNANSISEQAPCFSSSNYSIPPFTVSFYHVTYELKSESTFCNFLNVKEILDQNMCDIWKLSDSNETRTHSHLVRKATLTHLAKQAKWLSCVVSTYLHGANDLCVSTI